MTEKGSAAEEFRKQAAKLSKKIEDSGRRGVTTQENWLSAYTGDSLYDKKLDDVSQRWLDQMEPKSSPKKVSFAGKVSRTGEAQPTSNSWVTKWDPGSRS